MEMPEGLEYWTADEIAECLSFEKHLPPNYDGPHTYSKLWKFLSDAENPTPLGGDGSDGTVETPDGRLGLDNDDKPRHWWHLLVEEEQVAIAKAYDNY